MMMRGKRSLYWMAGIAGVVLLLVFALLLSAPLFVNLEGVHREIASRIDRETGGQGSFQKVEISLLPRPHAVIYEGKLSFPGGESVAFETLTLYPKLRPLLMGELLPSRIQCESLRADIDIRSIKEEKPSGPSGPQQNGKSKIGRAVRAWAHKTDGLTIRVEKGMLALSQGNNRKFRFSDIMFSAENGNGNLIFEATCSSNLFQHMDLKGRMELASLAAKGTLRLSGFKPAQLPEATRRHDTLRLKDGVLDLQADFQGIWPHNLKAAGNLSAPSLGLWRGPRKTVLEGVHLEGSVRLTENVLLVSLSHMALDDPAMTLSGVFKSEKEPSSVSLHLEGEDLKVPEIRSCALDLMGDVSTVKEIFDVVRGGNVPSISVDAKGKSPADLGNLTRYTIKGNMREGEISLAHPKLDLTEVEGSALISRGILSGQRLKARLSKTKGTEGILTVALENNAAPFQLDIGLDADLAEAHALLKRLVTTGLFAENLNQVRSLEGRAAARLMLEEDKGTLSVAVDCSACRLKARYDALPLPLTIEKGAIHYRRNRIRLHQLAGAYGQSQFLIASGLLDWRDKPQLNIASATATVLMEEVYPLLSVTHGSDTRVNGLEGIKGRLSVNALTLKGPLKNPAAWQYQADLQMENLLLNGSFLPGPLEAPEARFTADTGGISVHNARIKILDADANMDGRLTGPLKNPQRFETTLSGTLGSRSMQYLNETLEISHDFLLQAPLTIQSGRFLWDEGTGISVTANTTFPDGPSLSLDMSCGPGKINIRNLVVKDRDATASLALSAHEELVDLSFRGKLQKSTLDGIFEKNRVLEGWIEGDLSARILPAQSFSTSAEGSLAGVDIPIYGIGFPARIENFSLHAQGQLLRIDSARMVLGRNRLVMSGNADFSTEDPRFDVDISTKDVDLDEILAYVEESENTAAKTQKEAPWHFPVRGTAHLMWDSLKLGGFTWHPFQGEITLTPESIRVAVEDARLCSIFCPGTLWIRRDKTKLNFQLKAEKSDLNRSIACLTHKRVSAEGTFDLAGNISGEGDWENLFESVEGPLLFSSTNGRVKQDPALAQVLSILNVTDIFKGKLPSLEKDGLPYNLVQIKANLKNGKIQIEKGLMNSTALNLVFHGEVDPLNEQLDITMLASPFTLTDRLIRLIPVAGYILGGTLISVPVKINGSMKDPKVRILPLSEIGSGTWGILKRTLETPIRLVEPLVGEKETAKEKGDESTFW